MDNVQLNFEAGAIEAIAQEAHRRKTGARALRGIVEELMLDLMYELPSRKNVSAFTITRAMVEEHTGGKVLSLPGNDRQQESA
jgi:ATP-dependent Clp protease ATP-binding subunit ClpX